MTTDRDPTDLRAQERARAEADERVARQRRIELDDVRWLMSDKRGRRLIWRLFAIAGIYRTSFTGNSTTFFNEGRRDVGLHFLSDVQEACPERFLEMLKEQKEHDDGNGNGTRNH